MYSGKLDRRIVIEQTTPSTDSYGEPTDSWSTYTTVWASVRQIKASERFNSDKVLSVRTAVFKIRYNSGITEKMRINYDGRYWDILGIAEIGRQEGTEITAESKE